MATTAAWSVWIAHDAQDAEESAPGLAGCRAGDIHAYPLGSHAGIVVLHVPDQSAATVTKTRQWWPEVARADVRRQGG